MANESPEKNILQKKISKDALNFLYLDSFKNEYSDFKELRELFFTTAVEIFSNVGDLILSNYNDHEESNLANIERLKDKLAIFYKEFEIFELKTIELSRTLDPEKIELDDLLKTIKILELDSLILDEKLNFITENLNTETCRIFSNVKKRTKYDPIAKIHEYEKDTIPSPKVSITDCSNLSKKSSQRSLTSVKSYQSEIFQNNEISLSKFDFDKTIDFFERIVDSLEIDLQGLHAPLMFTLDTKQKFNCYLFYDIFRSFIDHNDEILKLTIHKIVVLDNGHLVIGETNNTLSIWDITDFEIRKIKKISHTNSNNLPVSQLKIKALPENKILYYIKGSLYLLEPNDKTYKHTKKIFLKHCKESMLDKIKFSKDIGVILNFKESEIVEIWHLDGGYLKCKLEGHLGWVHSIAILSNTELVTGSNKDQLIIWNLSDIRNPNKKYEFLDEFYLDSVNKIKIVKDLERILTLNARNTVRIFDYNLQCLYTIKDLADGRKPEPIMKPICLLGNYFVHLNNCDHRIKIYSIESGDVEECLSIHKSEILFMKWHGQYMFSTSKEGIIKISHLNYFNLPIYHEKQQHTDPKIKMKIFDPLGQLNEISRKAFEGVSKAKKAKYEKLKEKYLNKVQEKK
ncbi:unnamed protein product [Brachionus calyciflorus]|uniref:Uncharacterized protein n=1 Tax=Brachionus calyciflorus TaxID=104777 RepID=A0A813M2F9_9BILA|nr:unnamed protein product [Brachionus calyciflorus]